MKPTDIKIGDLVKTKHDDCVFEITELRGCSENFPDDCRGIDRDDGLHGLISFADIETVNGMDVKRPTSQPTDKPEWDGGVPPVGLECEARYRFPGTDYTQWFAGAKFKAGYDSKIWFCAEINPPFTDDLVLPSHDVEFRPLKTQADREREEFIDFVAEASGLRARDGRGAVAMDIVDAILARYELKERN